MDTRTTGSIVKNLAFGALQGVGVRIIDVDVCSTPALLYGHKFFQCDGTVIISASHNPPIYNGMKCLAPSGTFLSKEELNEINIFLTLEKPVIYVKWNEVLPIETRSDLTRIYLDAMKQFLDLKTFASQKSQPLRVVVDPGAGAGSGLTAPFLQELGCKVLEINAKLNPDGTFPREFEPIKPYLFALSQKISEFKAHVGFAHDCDADRVGLIGETGEIYPEDVILALIVNYTLNKAKVKQAIPPSNIKMVTNCASSLMLDDLAESYGVELIKTPVGERYLAERMNVLITDKDPSQNLIFGGEGSCGGFMLPAFNNTRDGIFAAVNICAILIETGKKISELVAELPHYVSLRKKIQLKSSLADDIMNKLRIHLKGKNVSFETIDNDVKINGEHEWTLVHPSNTEPIIRIITEAKIEQRAKQLLNEMDFLIGNL
jgi:phosphomannomutase